VLSKFRERIWGFFMFDRIRWLPIICLGDLPGRFMEFEGIMSCFPGQKERKEELKLTAT